MNEIVIVRNREKDAFALGMKIIANDNKPYNEEFKCDGYSVIDGELFLSRYSNECIKLPYRFNLEQTINFAWGWYENNMKPKENEPDTDGSTHVGFELTTETCGVGTHDWGMVCSIKPIWFVYGK